MKKFKKMIALATLMAVMASGATSVEAQDEYRSDMGGYGYEESRRNPSLAPAIALGTIALVAIIAVAVQNSHGGHGHGHSH